MSGKEERGVDRHLPSEGENKLFCPITSLFDTADSLLIGWSCGGLKSEFRTRPITLLPNILLTSLFVPLCVGVGGFVRQF